MFALALSLNSRAPHQLSHGQGVNAMDAGAIIMLVSGRLFLWGGLIAVIVNYRGSPAADRRAECLAHTAHVRVVA